MNLLLLLSALLSALSGVGSGARVPGAAQSVAASSVAVRVAPRQQLAATMRPVSGLPTLAHVATGAAFVSAPIAAAVPLWTSRRRE